MEINPNTQELEKINERLLELEQEKADLLAQKNRLIVKAFSTETINNSFNQNIDTYKLSTNQKVDLFAQPTREHMKQDVAAYMRYYNLDRLHTANGDQSPINYENFLKKVSGWT